MCVLWKAKHAGRVPQFLAQGVIFVLMGACTLGSLGCAAGSRGAASDAPVMLEPAQDIPVDLGFVVRIDVARLRGAMPEVIFELFMRLFLEALGAETFTPAAVGSGRLYLGMRPTGLTSAAAPLAMDYVLVLDQLTPQTSPDWTRDFHPPRDLGRAYFRYDAKRPEPRFSPARVYEKAGERLTIASAAEVDATERVIERHVRSRTVVPEERGVLSVEIDSEVFSKMLEPTSPRMSQLVARADDMRAYFEVNQQQCSGVLRAHFGLPSEAQRIKEALTIVLGALNVAGSAVKIEATVADADLIVRGSVPLAWVFALVGA